MREKRTAEIVRNLTGKIDDVSYDRITRYYPLALTCPTCDGEKSYRLDGKVYECDCELQRLLQRHYFAANIGREYHDICLEHFEGEDRETVVPVVQEYIETFPDNFHYGLGITFSGPWGTGKTFAMNCILKELVKQGRKVYFITFEELITTWGSAYSNDDYKILMERLMSVDVLGLDELKTDPRNRQGFLANGLDVLLRHRTSNLLPTLITTNMTPDQEEEEFGKAYSLLSARNNRVILSGKDQRGGLVRDRNLDLKEKGERRPIC